MEVQKSATRVFLVPLKNSNLNILFYGEYVIFCTFLVVKQLGILKMASKLLYLPKFVIWSRFPGNCHRLWVTRYTILRYQICNIFYMELDGKDGSEIPKCTFSLFKYWLGLKLGRQIQSVMTYKIFNLERFGNEKLVFDIPCTAVKTTITSKIGEIFYVGILLIKLQQIKLKMPFRAISGKNGTRTKYHLDFSPINGAKTSAF